KYRTAKEFLSARWQCVGPYTQNVKGTTSTRYTGRVLDIELNTGVGLRVASASGGLWEFSFGIPKAKSDILPTLAIGSFVTKPGDTDKIFVGTGEPWVRGGMGLYKTTDGGLTWSNVPLTPTPDAFYKIRYQQQYPDIIHFCSTQGYYKSTDDGVTFTRTLAGDVCDFDFAGYGGLMFAAVWGNGIYKSTNFGNTWTKISIAGINDADIGRAAISAFDQDIIYISICKNNDWNTLDVIKSIDGGSTWTSINPASEVHGGQGWYNCVISVCPTDNTIVLLGGIDLFRTTDGGSSWTKIVTLDMHPDQHRVHWDPDGSRCYAANDGGITYSPDQGATWDSWGNVLPITQYVNIDVAKESQVMFGGSQDNGYSGTTDYGLTWHHTFGGDGGGISIDRNDPKYIFGTLGVYGDPWSFQRHRSTNYGTDWDGVNTGIDPSGQWYNKIRHDHANPTMIYNNSGPYVYYSSNNGDSWNKLNTTAFPVEYTLNMRVRAGVVYASLEHRASADHTGHQLRVYDTGNWYERSAAFPNTLRVRTVTPHPANSSVAYALLTGLTPGQKLYKTTDRGAAWTNISGDLPNVPVADIVPHPTNDDILYLGSEMGCYKTSNGGTNWLRWNYGMPEANIITEMTIVDSLTENGKYYIVAGTYGRSMWQRDITAADPVVSVEQKNELPLLYILEQNYPNPFNPITVISYHLPLVSNVEIKIYDALGREIKNLINAEQPAGKYTVIWNGDDNYGNRVS
ncbi:hypothetical protein ACFLR4_05360, partial [Bacteroidota bacterium]